MESNNSGQGNTAVGAGALGQSIVNNYSTALGLAALGAAKGNYNIGIGQAAGACLGTGDYNVYLANCGAIESNTIRIGDTNHFRTFIAAIRGTTTDVADAIPVVIDSLGQLGTVSSSRRFKDDVADMNAASDALMKLRPVTFRYKSDRPRGANSLQYGLIAEEVDGVYPGLVAHSADGKIETVLYQHLPPMLLNDFQKQQRTIQAQAARIDALERQALELAALKQQVAQILDLQRQVVALAR